MYKRPLTSHSQRKWKKNGINEKLFSLWAMEIRLYRGLSECPANRNIIFRLYRFSFHKPIKSKLVRGCLYLPFTTYKSTTKSATLRHLNSGFGTYSWMDSAGWTDVFAFSTADTFRTVWIFINLDTHITFLCTKSAFRTFGGINLVMVEWKPVENTINRTKWT